MKPKIIITIVSLHIVALMLILTPLVSSKNKYCLEHKIHANIKYYVSKNEVFILNGNQLIKTEQNERFINRKYLSENFNPIECPSNLNTENIGESYSKSIREKIFETDLGN